MTHSLAREGEELSAGRAVMAALADLARFSSQWNGLTRLYLTPEHKRAALHVQAWMQDAGMAASIDPVGNVVGRYEGRRAGAPALILGSHIDTVRDAGHYDGNLGVVAAIQVVAALHDAGERLDHAIEVIAFGDEEGVRFPTTLTGSRAVAGTLEPERLDGADADGTTLREALHAFGADPAGATRIGRRPEQVLAYLELHIEQGPVLEEAGLPLGVVTAIAGASRFAVTVTGVAGHSGTVPMGLRHDALAAGCEMALGIERIAGGATDLVGTVGQMLVHPGAANVIPGEVRFTIDIRSPEDAVRLEAVRAVEAELHVLARRRGVAALIQPTFEAPAATCAPWLVQQTESAVLRAGLRPLRLPSGAGHDGLAMAALCPIGMLFVRCRGGISHNPAEAITPEDAEIAFRVLLDIVRRFQTPRGPS